MRRGLTLTALLLLCAASAPADDAKKDDKKDDDKLVTLGQVAGVLTTNGGSEADYNIRVTLYVPQPNEQAQADLLRKQRQIAQKQLEIMRTRNPVQRQKQMVELLKDAQQMPQNLWTIKEVKQDIKAAPADDMKVRLLQPPEAFDDKGHPKKYTAKELKELKGPDNLPGYTGALEDVKTNQLVLVTLARKPAKADEKDTPLLIRMLVILADKK
jgi:hypothetical protein